MLLFLFCLWLQFFSITILHSDDNYSHLAEYLTLISIWKKDWGYISVIAKFKIWTHKIMLRMNPVLKKQFLIFLKSFEKNLNVGTNERTKWLNEAAFLDQKPGTLHGDKRTCRIVAQNERVMKILTNHMLTGKSRYTKHHLSFSLETLQTF